MSIETNSPQASAWSRYGASSLAAGFAVTPLFYGFLAKSNLQKGLSWPQANFRMLVTEGLKVAPIISTQVLIQKVLEGKIKQILPGEINSTYSSVICTLAVAVASVPALTAFSAYSNGVKPLNALKNLTKTQASLLMGREMSFLLGVQISEPVCEKMKATLGDRQVVVYSSAFMTGLICSLAGYPFDTAFTGLQAGVKILPHHLMRGALTRATTVGVFVVLYTRINEIFKKMS